MYINAEALAQGRKLFPDLDLRKNDGLQIPFDDHFFDLVFAGGVLKHIRPKDRPKLYNEFERVAAYVMAWEEIAEEPHEETWGGFTFYKANFEVELGARFSRAHQIKVGNQLFGVYATASTK